MSENDLMEEIRERVVNDYFTPNIKAEVILDTLLTPYIPQIVRGQLGEKVGSLTFLTKEMSISDEGDENNRGPKIDYVLEDDNFVYLVELKTTKGSINTKQAERYIRNCYGRDKTFCVVLGKRLLDIMNITFKFDHPWTAQTLLTDFQQVTGEGKKTDSERCAKSYLGDKRLASTRKYLYTVGQLLEHHAGEIQDLWEKPLRLVYLTPNGDRVFPKKPRKKDKQKQDKAEREWEELRARWKELYIAPDGIDSSVSLKASVGGLRDAKDDLAQLLADIITEIYGG